MEKPKLVVVTQTYYDYNQCVDWLVETGKLTRVETRKAWHQVVDNLHISNREILNIDRPSCEKEKEIPGPDDDDFDDDYLSWVFELIWEEFGITDDDQDFIFKW